MTKHSSNWKRVEACHSIRLGSEVGRTGPTGLDLPDSISYTYGLAIESKSRDSLPAWLADAVSQSVNNLRVWNTRHPDQAVAVPVVVLHQNGLPYNEDLVVFRLIDVQYYLLPLLAQARPPEST